MTKQDYTWCFNENATCTMQFGGPSACTGYDVCGSDGCDIEYCGFDCGRDCYTDWDIKLCNEVS